MNRVDVQRAPRARLPFVWLAVLLLHGLLAWLLLQSAPPRRAGEAARESRVTLRLLPWVTPTPMPTAAPEPPPDRPRPRAITRAPSTTATTPTTIRPATLPSDVSPGSISPLTNAAPAGRVVTPPDAGASEPSRPLDLTLRPSAAASTRSVRDQALSDPRSNSRIGPEQRMARTLGGDGSMTEENLGDGRRRFRQNGKCFEARPSRAAQLDPYRGVPAPNAVGEC